MHKQLKATLYRRPTYLIEVDGYFPSQFISVIKHGVGQSLAQADLDGVLNAIRQNDLTKAVGLLQTAGYGVEVVDL